MNHSTFRSKPERAAGGFFVLLAAFLLLAAPSALAKGSGPSIIRDAEIEETLKSLAAPLVRAAGLEGDSVRLILIQSPDVNAFVAGGPNIFIHTGLLVKSENPGEVAGVIAHELGHIAGGHLVRTRAAMRDAAWEAMAGTLIGIGAALASGEGGAAGAIALGSQSMAMRGFLAHSRVQESSADQAAISLMGRAGYDPSGLVSFLEKLGGGDALAQSAEAEYVRTHPLSANRIEALRASVAASPHKGKGFAAEQVERHARMKAKLVGFIAPEQVSWHFGDRDPSIAASYARAIAAYRQSQVQEALSTIDGLIAKEPDNAYFHELKGQMLLEFGRVREAVESYRKAVVRRPDSGLIRIDLARALVALAGEEGARALLDEAISNLTRAARDEPRSATLHRLLATSYGKSGREPLARLHLAEEALLLRRLPEARRLAESAARDLPRGEPAAQRARDILTDLDRIEREKGED